jgi:hypothetical protein
LGEVRSLALSRNVALGRVETDVRSTCLALDLDDCIISAGVFTYVRELWGAGHLIDIDRVEFDEKFYPDKTSRLRRASVVCEDDASAHAQRCHAVQTQQHVLSRLMRGMPRQPFGRIFH